MHYHLSLLPNCRWEVVASKIPLELIQQHGGLEGLKGMGVAMQFYQRRLMAIRVGAFIPESNQDNMKSIFLNLHNFSLPLAYL